MVERSLSPTVTSFLNRYIDTVEKLEVLLIIREEQSKWWRVSEINAALRSTEYYVQRRVEELTSDGILKNEDDTFQFSPKNISIAEAISEVAVAYRERRMRVIELIYSKASREIQCFTDAFKIRKEEDDG